MYLVFPQDNILNQNFIISKYRFVIHVVLPSSPYTKSFCVVFFTPKRRLQNCRCTLSIAFACEKRVGLDSEKRIVSEKRRKDAKRG